MGSNCCSCCTCCSPSILKAIVTNHRVVLFTKPNCHISHDIRVVLDDAEVHYNIVEVDMAKTKTKLVRELIKKTGYYSVPLMFIKKEFVGGGEHLLGLAISGELARMAGGHNFIIDRFTHYPPKCCLPFEEDRCRKVCRDVEDEYEEQHEEIEGELTEYSLKKT